MKHYGDITKLSGKDLPVVDIIVGGSPCFAAGTLVTTFNGLVPIEDVKVGDRVLTHNNRFRAVIDGGYTGDKETYLLYGSAFDTLQVTGNHKFYVRKRNRVWDNIVRSNKRVFANPEWKELNELDKNYYLGIAINNLSENIENITIEESYLVGRYIADGYINRNQVIFCIGDSKKDDFESHLLTNYSTEHFSSCTKYKVSSSRLVHLCSLCGKGAENKEIPYNYINLPVEYLKVMLDSYMSGDGCYSQNKYKATTVSRKLAYSLGQCIAKVYKMPYCIYKTDVPDKTIIEGRVVNQHTQYQITFKTDVRKQDRAFYENGYIWSPITKIIKSNTVPTYDLTVEEDESYCVNNIIAHNCQDLSVAGKRGGLSAERSGLFMDQLRIIKEMRENDKANGKANEFIRPRYMVWENVPGAFSSNGGEDFRVVLEETAKVIDPSTVIPKPPQNEWTPSGAIMGKGWSIAWRVHDAQFWGVPQRRRRIALVADFGGLTAPEILFERNSLPGNIEESGNERQTTSETVRNSSEKSIVLEGNGSRPSHLGNGYAESDVSYTLNSTEQHAVCYEVENDCQTAEAPSRGVPE